MNVQGVKDAFYAALRDRVAAGNAARTVVVRGTRRPGVVVAENELPGAAVDGIGPVDAFCLRWTGLSVDTQGAATTVKAVCEVRYATDGAVISGGAAGAAGLDRGRALAAMDSELMAAIGTAPQSAAAMVVSEVAGGGASTVTAAGAKVFWGDVVFKPAVMRGERMERTAEVEVFCYGQ